MKPIIITMSGKARSGKNYFTKLLSKELKKNNYYSLEIANADYLKFAVEKYLRLKGKKTSLRKHYQLFGTEVMRSIDPSCHVKNVSLMIQSVDKYKPYDFYIVTDCRFPNEITELSKIGNVLSVNVIRDDTSSNLSEDEKSHKSENSMGGYQFSIEIENYGTKKELKLKAAKLAEDLIRMRVL